MARKKASRPAKRSARGNSSRRATSWAGDWILQTGYDTPNAAQPGGGAALYNSGAVNGFSLTRDETLGNIVAYRCQPDTSMTDIWQQKPLFIPMGSTPVRCPQMPGSKQKGKPYSGTPPFAPFGAPGLVPGYHKQILDTVAGSVIDRRSECLMAGVMVKDSTSGTVQQEYLFLYRVNGAIKDKGKRLALLVVQLKPTDSRIGSALSARQGGTAGGNGKPHR